MEIFCRVQLQVLCSEFFFKSASIQKLFLRTVPNLSWNIRCQVLKRKSNFKIKQTNLLAKGTVRIVIIDYSRWRSKNTLYTNCAFYIRADQVSCSLFIIWNILGEHFSTFIVSTNFVHSWMIGKTFGVCNEQGSGDLQF